MGRRHKTLSEVAFAMLAVRFAYRIGRAAAIWLTIAALSSGTAFAAEATIAPGKQIQEQTKFPAEPETRAAMETIRRRVINIHTLITHRRLPIAGAAQFGREVDADVERVSQARQALDQHHDPMAPILQQIRQGATTIAHPTVERGQVDGLVDVVSALETYGATFDHPGWQRLQQQ